MLGFALADNYARNTRLAGAQSLPGFNQRIFAAALMDACGRGQTTPPITSIAAAGPADQPLMEFLELRREFLACGELRTDLPVEGLDGMQRSSPYLLMLTSAVWKLTGPSWRGIDHLLGLMFGLSVGLAYVTCRLSMGWLASSAVATMLLFSPIQLSNLSDLRDYSKAPFFLATMLAIVWLVSARRNFRRVVAVAATIGVILGVGFGIRTDIAVGLPAVLAAIIVFYPGSLRDTWRQRTIAAAVFALGCGAAAMPALRAQTSANNLWHWALLGYAHEWDHALGITPPSYETGYFYNDSYVATLVDAYHARVTSSRERISVGEAGYADMSGQYYRQLIATFPADALVRGWASEIRLLDLPYVASGAIPGGRVPPIVWRITSVMNRLRSVLAGSGIVWFAILAIAISTVSLRLGLAVFVVVSYLSAYPAVQFQLRHVFQLEILGLWTAALLASLVANFLYQRSRAAADAGATPPQLRRAAVFVAIVAGFVLLPTWTLRAYQTRAATTLLESYERADLDVIDTTPVPTEDGSMRIFAEGALIPAPAGSRAVGSNMLVLEIGGAGCREKFVALTFRYLPEIADFDFSRTLQVPAATDTTKVYFPVFESGPGTPMHERLAFAGVGWSEADSSCVMRLSRFSAPEHFRLLLPVILEPGWRTHSLYQTLESSPPAAPETITYRTPVGYRTDRNVDAAGVRVSLGAPIEFQARSVRVDSATGVRVDGVSDAPHAYLLSTIGAPVDESGVLIAEGWLDQGGLTIGFVDGTSWVAKVDIDRAGPFRALVHPPRPGHYQMVVANHLSNTSLRNRFTISRLSVVD